MRVAASSSAVFDELWKALKERVERYNERHPQDRFFPNAVWIHHNWDARHFRATIQKNIEPKNLLSIVFPINSGEMACKFALAGGALDAALTLDVTDGVPQYFMDGETYSADTMADALLEPVLSPKWPPDAIAGPTTPKRTIGFKP